MNNNYIDTQVPTAEPRLPPEIEHIIFEIAARNDRDRTLPVLLQVAHRVRSWLQAVVYDTVVLRNSYFYKRSKSPSHHPPRFPSGSQALHVRNFFVGINTHTSIDSEPQWLDLLPQCHNLQDLAICVSIEVTPSLLPLLTSTIQSPLRTVSPHGLLRLSVTLGNLFLGGKIDFNHEIFKDITHLDVLDSHILPCNPWVEGNNYGCIPNLRYLSIAEFDNAGTQCMELMQTYLRECKTLELLVITEDADSRITEHMNTLLKTTRKIAHSDGTMSEVPEDRVVVYRGIFAVEWTGAWYKSAVRGGTARGYDFWLRSEKIVQKRRRRVEWEKSSWDSMLDSEEDIDLREWMIALGMY